MSPPRRRLIRATPRIASACRGVLKPASYDGSVLVADDVGDVIWHATGERAGPSEKELTTAH